MMVLAVAAATVGEIPHLGYLFASETVVFNKVFAEAAVHIPSPAFATTRPFFA